MTSNATKGNRVKFRDVVSPESNRSASERKERRLQFALAALSLGAMFALETCDAHSNKVKSPPQPKLQITQTAK